jgi:hypothetical protein
MATVCRSCVDMCKRMQFPGHQLKARRALAGLLLASNLYATAATAQVAPANPGTATNSSRDVSGDAPYLVSTNPDDVVFDAQRARLLTRDQYAQRVVPAVRQNLASQEPGRWSTFSFFVGTVQNADLLTSEIVAFLADPRPSNRRETLDGQSDKATNVARVADAAVGNSALVDALLNAIDADPALLASPGYRRLISNLAGISSSMPIWGSPQVCANASRIAKYLPWGRDTQTDAKYLATLSRCNEGSEDILRTSLLDARPVIVATGLRVWWAVAAGGKPTAQKVSHDVMALIVRGHVPTADAFPIHRYWETHAALISGGDAMEDVSLGLSALGLLTETVERLNTAGQTEQARALLQANERGMQRQHR